MIQLIKHPVVEHNLTVLRNKNTGNADFRHSANVIAHFLALEAFSDLPLVEKNVETPLEKYQGKEIISDIVLVPVLRAGLALLEAFTFIMPSAKISFVGLSRNEKDFSINEYYFSAPNFVEQTRFIILEMMIATGSSVVSAINRLQLEGAGNFTVCSIIAAPEGVENILTNYPNIKIITAALDRELNDKKYILPGLGDAGDRWCGV
ncbi:MAG: uracil phosphoribosyltransferase [Ignavibacteria bacterium]|nr:uracil phosphoribosyltransferase [Ignavibacteria bacterium]